MGRHTAPARRPAQRTDPRKRRAPHTAPALPLAALVLTGLACAGAAAVGTTQAADAAGRHTDAGSRQALTQTLSARGDPAPASREHRVALGPAADVGRNVRTVPPTRSPSSAAPGGDSADAPVTATGHCVASYYDTGSITANGEPFDTGRLTAASKTLPFGTRVKVINDATKQSVVVRINDRGPYVAGRCLDLTPAAMRVLAGPSVGTVQVTYEVLGK